MSCEEGAGGVLIVLMLADVVLFYSRVFDFGFSEWQQTMRVLAWYPLKVERGGGEAKRWVC